VTTRKLISDKQREVFPSHCDMRHSREIQFIKFYAVTVDGLQTGGKKTYLCGGECVSAPGELLDVAGKLLYSAVRGTLGSDLRWCSTSGQRVRHLVSRHRPGANFTHQSLLPSQQRFVAINCLLGCIVHSFSESDYRQSHHKYFALGLCTPRNEHVVRKIGRYV